MTYSMEINLRWMALGLVLCTTHGVACSQPGAASNQPARNSHTIRGNSMSVAVRADGDYSIDETGTSGSVLTSGVEADLASGTVRSSSYPRHAVTESSFNDEFGAGKVLRVVHTGRPDAPDLICSIRLYRDRPWGDLEVTVHNTTGSPIQVKGIRTVHVSEGPVVNLAGPASADRILSDSYSEDRPQLTIRDLGEAPDGVHRAVGSQLIYNRQSGHSLFIGALTSDRLLTIFHLNEQSGGASPKLLSFEAVAKGTTEIMKGESLRSSPASQQVDLSLPLKPGENLSSERLMFSAGTDYHAQLEQYGAAIRQIHKARIDTPTPIGWWSWTAYYFGLNQGAAITNANWLGENLKPLGYNFFQIDEGYQYARGEYTTADAVLFPKGIGYVANRVVHDGLTFGVWTAPFEVSNRAWVYQNHKDWLLHNAAGELIHIGYVTEKNDPLYVLDTTNPGAQAYLRQTYITLRNWGVRFIKMDFMDDSAVEGAYYRPNTTALEAQRIGLKIIRESVGDDVVLDKDGSPMLNPVGIVDAGRISQDTGHTFGATRDAASGVAARYYMNRNFFVSDPDAFTVSTQTVDDQSWHGGQHPLTLEEAKASIALSAVSGGMFEIGDDLPTLGSSPERVALVKNKDLIEMAQMGRASVPIDLMTYPSSDLQPSIFLLKQDPRQAILTVFNWSDKAAQRDLDLKTLGLATQNGYKITEVFGAENCCNIAPRTISFLQPGHSVRMFKLVDESVAVSAPSFRVQDASTIKAGESVAFREIPSDSSSPVVRCHWDFGDGTSSDGTHVVHTYTHAGTYQVHVTATGLNETTASRDLRVSITGAISTRFDPMQRKRPE